MRAFIVSGGLMLGLLPMTVNAQRARLAIVHDGCTLPLTADALGVALRVRLPTFDVEVEAAPNATVPNYVLRCTAAELVLRAPDDDDDLWRATSDDLEPGAGLIRAAAVLVAAAIQIDQAHRARAARQPPPLFPSPPLPRSYTVVLGVAPTFTVHTGGSTVFGVALQASWLVGDGVWFGAGARLDGEVTAAVKGGDVGVSNRAVWLGGGYRLALPRDLHLDLGLAVQYSHPVIDASGTDVDDPTDRVGARFSVRPTVSLGWDVYDHLSLDVGFAGSAGFAEHEFFSGETEAISLGAFSIDVLMGVSLEL